MTEHVGKEWQCRWKPRIVTGCDVPQCQVLILFRHINLCLRPKTTDLAIHGVWSIAYLMLKHSNFPVVEDRVAIPYESEI